MIYVTPLDEYIAPSKWRWRYSCLCLADTKEELLDFAEKVLNIRTKWWLELRYDSVPTVRLDREKRAKAIEHGATEINVNTADWFALCDLYE